MQILAVLLNKCLQIYNDGDDDVNGNDDDGNDDDDDDDDDNDNDDDDNDDDDNDDDDHNYDPPGKPQHCPSPASPTPRQSTAKTRMRLYPNC